MEDVRWPEKSSVCVSKGISGPSKLMTDDLEGFPINDDDKVDGHYIMCYICYVIFHFPTCQITGSITILYCQCCFFHGSVSFNSHHRPSEWSGVESGCCAGWCLSFWGLHHPNWFWVWKQKIWLVNGLTMFTTTFSFLLVVLARKIFPGLWNTLHQATPSAPTQRTVPVPAVPVPALVAPVAQPEKKAREGVMWAVPNFRLREPVWYSISWGYPPPTNSEIIICSFLWRAPQKNLHFPLLVGRGYPQPISMSWFLFLDVGAQGFFVLIYIKNDAMIINELMSLSGLGGAYKLIL